MIQVFRTTMDVLIRIDAAFARSFWEIFLCEDINAAQVSNDIFMMWIQLIAQLHIYLLVRAQEIVISV